VWPATDELPLAHLADDELAAAVFDPDPESTDDDSATAAEADTADDGSTAGPRPLTNLGAARVLILNASYEPLHVCSVKRAITLLMQEVAERVLDGDRVLRTPSLVVPVPSVIRLRRYVRRPHRQRVAFNRKNVFRRDDHSCQYCGTRGHDLTLDHVLPRSRGGPTTWENVVACCRRCNASKRDRTPEEARMVLRRRPRAPAFMFTSAYGVLPDVDPAWEAYLPSGR
jgi:5-methylcytosine-specific restriction endonuclease McrA